MNTRKEISESDLSQFENLDNLPEDYFIFNLGVGLQYEYSPPGILYSAPYIEMGEKLWGAFRSELYNLLCNEKTKKPNEWLNDLVTGDIRNLAIGIISAITAKYDVSMGIAVPATALIIKNGLLKFCSTPPIEIKETATEILLSMRSVYEKKKSQKAISKEKKISKDLKRKKK